MLYCLAFASQILHRNIYQIPLLFWVAAYLICHSLRSWSGQSCGLLMYMQFVTNLRFLFWSSFLQLPLPLEKLVMCRSVSSPSRSSGELADACWGSSRPPLRGFYLHAPFLADRFQISRRGAFQPTDCSAGLQHPRCHPAPHPLCVGTDLRVLLPLGSPAIAPRQHPAEQRWRWVVGQVPARWV